MRLFVAIILFFGGIITSCTNEQIHSEEPSDERPDELVDKQAGFMHPTAQINFVKRQLQEEREPYLSAYRQLIKAADKALPASHNALADYNVPGYFQQPQEHMDNSRCLQTDAFNAYSCALA